MEGFIGSSKRKVTSYTRLDNTSSSRAIRALFRNGERRVIASFVLSFGTINDEKVVEEDGVKIFGCLPYSKVSQEGEEEEVARRRGV